MIDTPQTAIDAVTQTATVGGIAGGGGLTLAIAWAIKVFAKSGELNDLKDRVIDLERHRETLPDKYASRDQIAALEQKIDYLGERADKDTAVLRVEVSNVRFEIAAVRESLDQLKNLLMDKFTKS